MVLKQCQFYFKKLNLSNLLVNYHFPYFVHITSFKKESSTFELFQQCNDNFIIPPLPQHLSLKGYFTMLSGSHEYAHHLV